jgi:hypothetical protein
VITMIEFRHCFVFFLHLPGWMRCSRFEKAGVVVVRPVTLNPVHSFAGYCSVIPIACKSQLLQAILTRTLLNLSDNTIARVAVVLHHAPCC